ncbi:unknown [Gryllus bimaculatus nudivirus]|uniref:Uncharacterized protein n=1 Tax=Gryllus bimaculatus nudivirus TaxID=432587 RepID=A4L1Y0_9VIRU|nr:hypothetical protein GrBNV_gp17 [Gryllus bimaculatus nudivirus]ABO45350.1 unknown [Gryllus bimaculatus nudivirus]
MEMTEKQFKNFISEKTNIPVYVGFDDSSQSLGISFLLREFKNFDAVNELTNQPWKQSRSTKVANELLFSYVDLYFNNEHFNENTILKTNKYDKVMYALFSYLLFFDTDSLIRYGDYNKTITIIINGLLECRRLHQVKCVILNNKMYPYVRSTFKILNSYFKNLNNNMDTDIICFDIRNYISNEFVIDCYSFLNCLNTETYNSHVLNFIEDESRKPCISFLKELSSTSNECGVIKYVTGQACTGKTTVLNALSTNYCYIKSRHSMGTFSGKSKSSETVAALHFAIDHNLSKKNVLGDRGSIDNPLWRWIMHACNPVITPHKNLVDECLRFLSSSFNSSSFEYLAKQRVAVFIDLLPSENKKRMLERNKGGDAFRARIKNYAIAQTVAYFIIAKLCGWKIITVPYDLSKKIYFPHKYQDIIKNLITFFNFEELNNINAIENKDDLKPLNDYNCDFEFAINCGIYK